MSEAWWMSGSISGKGWWYQEESIKTEETKFLFALGWRKIQLDCLPSIEHGLQPYSRAPSRLSLFFDDSSGAGEGWGMLFSSDSIVSCHLITFLVLVRSPEEETLQQWQQYTRQIHLPGSWVDSGIVYLLNHISTPWQVFKMSRWRLWGPGRLFRTSNAGS